MCTRGVVILMFEFVPLEEFMCLVFTRTPGESYRRRLIMRFFLLFILLFRLSCDFAQRRKLVHFSRCITPLVL